MGHVSRKTLPHNSGYGIITKEKKKEEEVKVLRALGFLVMLPLIISVGGELLYQGWVRPAMLFLGIAMVGFSLWYERRQKNLPS